MKRLSIILALIIISNISSIPTAQAYTIEQKREIIALYNANKLQEAYQMVAKIPEEERDAEMWLLIANITQDYNKELDSFFLLQKAIEKDPKFFKAYYNLANLYMNDNKLTKAIENFNLSIKYNKNFAYAYYNLGCCYLKLNDYKKAKSYFAKAIQIKNTEPSFHYNLALVYKKLNNKKEAEKALNNYNKLLEVI